MYYKALGFIVWRLGTRYLRKRYGTAPKKIGAGALAAAGIAGAIVIAQRRLSHSGEA
ncbi:hypothetical protein VSS74_27795 [Conexibacter stalactiti]|uniref:Secreted protein with PEP-CTERM sorting signal n=1 Tax=Conexibacter stalactiti TaxID=1940611 RepID=A0ABU4HZR0_9ACTN|nr:hypothetical protein [Conexibacter stalactiti]MDW5598192.1 hypothetical protein [Conexibacter stalactiti]MEC5038834.1 hypothetical protein [Conexibacter stalactiti]